MVEAHVQNAETETPMCCLEVKPFGTEGDKKTQRNLGRK